MFWRGFENTFGGVLMEKKQMMSLSLSRATHGKRSYVRDIIV
ncbi:MAG: hypothetical protein ACI8V2_005219, partial [Candidatus Latescibacterota bacterium]